MLCLITVLEIDTKITLLLFQKIEDNVDSHEIKILKDI